MELATGYQVAPEEYGYARYALAKEDVDLNHAISRVIDEMRGDQSLSKIIAEFGLTDRNLWYYDPTVGKWERRTDRERIAGTDSRRQDFDQSDLAGEYDPEFVAEEKLAYPLLIGRPAVAYRQICWLQEDEGRRP